MNDLMPHQEDGIRFAMSRKKTAIIHAMRLGKTRLAIEYADRMGAFPAMVICPASLRNVWAEQIKLWAPHLRVQVLVEGTDKFKRGADFHVVSYEYITKTMQIPISKIRLLIIDEAHYLKNIASKRTQRIWQLIDRVTLTMMLSGTLIPNRPEELYTILRMLGAINMDYNTYTKRFCAAHPTPWGTNVSGASNLDELSFILEPFMHYRTLKMVVKDLPPVGRQVISLDLPLDKREKEFNLEEIKKAESAIAFEGLTDLLVFIGAQKALEAIKFIENTLKQTDKVVVFFQYHSTAALLLEGLQKYDVAEHHGKNTKTRGEDIKRFQTDPKTRVILVQIKTAVGISLWAANTTIFAESSWVPGDLAQAEARVTVVHGTPQPTFHYYLTIHRSIDEHMLFKILKKQENIDKIMGTGDSRSAEIEALM